MRLVAALAWYDEPVAFLDRCVRSLAGVVDELIALDGRYDLYDPGSPVNSHWSQAQAIGVAADGVALESRVYMGSTTWESQVAKRAHLMQLAADADADWVFVIDGDEYVAEAHPGHLRPALAETELDVAMVRCSRVDESIPTQSIRRIYRAGTTVLHAHNGYQFEGRWLHGDSARVELEPALDLARHLHLHNATGLRGFERNRRAIEYRTRRAREREEAWV